MEVTLAEDSPAVDREIAQVGIPKGATIVAVVRTDNIVVPRGDTILRIGDEVLALVTSDTEEQVKHLLVGGT